MSKPRDSSKRPPWVPLLPWEKTQPWPVSAPTTPGEKISGKEAGELLGEEGRAFVREVMDTFVGSRVRFERVRRG